MTHLKPALWHLNPSLMSRNGTSTITGCLHQFPLRRVGPPVASSPVTTSPVTTSPVTTSPVTTSPVTSSPVTSLNAANRLPPTIDRRPFGMGGPSETCFWANSSTAWWQGHRIVRVGQKGVSGKVCLGAGRRRLGHQNMVFNLGVKVHERIGRPRSGHSNVWGFIQTNAEWSRQDSDAHPRTSHGLAWCHPFTTACTTVFLLTERLNRTLVFAWVFSTSSEAGLKEAT